MLRTCVSAVAVCVLLAAPASGQESALREGLDDMARNIVKGIDAEATGTDERLRVTFRPARTTPLERTDIWCEPLSSGLRNALHERVQWHSEDMRMNSFDLAVAEERAVEPPDVTMSWAWDGADSVGVEAHVLLSGERGHRGARYSASLPVSKLEKPERACLFAFREGDGRVEAKRAGILREEPSSDPTRFVRPFEAGETFLFVGELSTGDENGAVWSVVLGEDPERGGFRNLFAPNLAGGAADRERDAAAFEAARRADTVSAYDGYLSEWPSGAYASEARSLRAAAAAEREREERDAAAFEAARRSDTVSAYEEYLEAWPSGAHVSDARRFLEAARVPPVGSVFRDCAHCPEMIVVPSGRFTMSSPSSEEGRYDDEGPQHGVTIGSAFAVGVYEVTFAEWDACVSSGGCGGYRPDDWGMGRGQRPVINVSWEDAQSYVGWLSRETGKSYRLLSESEWEYVARAGTVTRYWWGNAIGVNRANCDGCGSRWDGERTAPVGSFTANAFGLHDVHGNVWEWVEDCWNDRYAGAPRDGSAWESGECSLRVLRGGSWVNGPRDLRAADRNWVDSGNRDNYVGFRVARAFTP